MLSGDSYLAALWAMRSIDQILRFRSDISPFLVHLTKRTGLSWNKSSRTAHQNLRSILESSELRPGSAPVSDAQYGYAKFLSERRKKELFGATCFTETPVSEIHCLFEIAYRSIHLEPYGLVFVKTALAECGVSPVLYLNNITGTTDSVFQALASLIDSHPDEARNILPLISVFGKKVKPPNAPRRQPGSIDFRWEREWRYPAIHGPFCFDHDDVFIGLCPHGEIDEFERDFPNISFIDPLRNAKYYAQKLIANATRLSLDVSVV